MKIAIDSERLTHELETLATFSDAPAPAVTRVVFSDRDLQARAWFRRLCGSEGLALRDDAVGNMFARWRGIEPSLAPVGTGSHIDAIPHSGRYDGPGRGAGRIGRHSGSARCWLSTPAICRAAFIHVRRTYPFRYRMPGVAITRRDASAIRG